MIHPAFDTQTDSSTRKQESAKQQQYEELKKKNEENKKKLKEAEAQAKASGSAEDDAALKKAEEAAKKTQDEVKKVEAKKTPDAPAISAEVQKNLSAIQEAQIAQAEALSASEDASALADGMNLALSAMVMPINAALEAFKKIPPALRSLVDVDGAAKGMYASLADIQASSNKIQVTTTSSEVPITLKDYQADPTKYPKLEAQQVMTNSITEADCLSSGYTKTIISSSQTVVPQPQANFMNPEDNDIVAKNSEKTFAQVTKPILDSVKPPIQSVAGIANLGPIGSMLDGIIAMVEGIGQIASIEVPEEQLNQKIKQAEMADAANMAEAETAAFASPPANSQQQAAEDAKAQAEQTKQQLAQQEAAVKSSLSNAFAQMKMPPMPDGIGESLGDLAEALQMVVTNIQNVFIVILFKLVEAIFKCFNQIVGVIGVPTMPYPLNIIPKLITDVINIMTFIMGLPASLMNQTKAIVHRKVKAQAVASMPAPQKTVETVEPIEPTAIDVPMIRRTTWATVEDALHERWHFSERDASDISDELEDFYDGSDKDDDGNATYTSVYVGLTKTESPVKPGSYDENPKFTKVERSLLKPGVALEEWLPQHISSIDENGKKVNVLSIPVDTDGKMLKFTTYETIRSGPKAGQINKSTHAQSFSWSMKTFKSE